MHFDKLSHCYVVKLSARRSQIRETACSILQAMYSKSQKKLTKSWNGMEQSILIHFSPFWSIPCNARRCVYKNADRPWSKQG